MKRKKDRTVTVETRASKSVLKMMSEEVALATIEKGLRFIAEDKSWPLPGQKSQKRLSIVKGAGPDYAVTLYRRKNGTCYASLDLLSEVSIDGGVA